MNLFFSGADCNADSTAGVWYLEEPRSDLPSGRASHCSVIYNNAMWVVSGGHLDSDPFDQLAK